MMVSEILTSKQERQNQEEQVVAVESPASLFPMLPSGQSHRPEEVVWIEGTITVSF